MSKSLIPTGKLEKAILTSDESDNIEFQFNPAKLQFKQSITLNVESAARTEEGSPKVSFKGPCTRVLTISDIRFDTYETGENVIEKYIGKFLKALDFADKGEAKGKRPPTYTFIWGQNQYIRRCFIESLDFDITRFLIDGTPVQAVISSLELKEVESIAASGSTNPFGRGSTPNR